MYVDQPKRVYPAELRLRQTCPASSQPRRTKKPDNALTRWIATKDAIVQWYIEGTPTDVARIEQDLFGALDPVQRELCERAFRSWRDRIGPGGDAVLDVLSPSVASEDGRFFMSTAMQMELHHDDGSTEFIKLKSRTPTSPEERAIITLGGEPDADYMEVLLDPGQVDTLRIEPAEAETIISELFTIADSDFDKTRHVGGFHCWLCDRVSLCRQYPPLGDGPPPGGTKSVTLSKGTLARLSECPRRVAWKAIFQVPPDASGFDDEGFSPALAMGNQFHAAIAMALLDDDPDGVMESHARALPGSEQSEFLGLWETHKALQASSPHAVDVVTTELPMGCTAPAPTGDDTHAVTFLGVVDAAGREPDGTAAVIEHRTTMRRDLPHLEQELYAVAGALAVKAERVAVHHHWLRAPLEEACTRRVFEATDLEKARDLLVDAAIEIASWDREDATDAPYASGEWCGFCPYQALCLRHRG